MRFMERLCVGVDMRGVAIALVLALVGGAIAGYGGELPQTLNMSAFEAWATVIDQPMSGSENPWAIDGSTARVEEDGEVFHRGSEMTIIKFADREVRSFLLRLRVRFGGAVVALTYRDDPDETLQVALATTAPTFASVSPKDTAVPIAEAELPPNLEDGEWHDLTIVQTLNGAFGLYLDDQRILDGDTGGAQAASAIRLWINTRRGGTLDIQSVLLMTGDDAGSAVVPVSGNAQLVPIEELGTAEKEDRTLRVLTYNILHGGIDEFDQAKVVRSIEAGSLWNEGYAQRLAGTIDLLRYVNADIIAFQELMHWQLSDNCIAEEVAQALGMSYVLGPQMEWGENHLSLGVFSRYEIIDSAVLTQTWDGVCPPLLVEIALPDGSQLDVIDLHAAADGSDTDRLADMLPPHADERTIVLGDFNALPINVSYGLVGAGGWGHVSGHLVDLIYVSEPLAPHSTEPLDLLENIWNVAIPSICDQRETNRNRLSDHLPQVMEVDLGRP